MRKFIIAAVVLLLLTNVVVLAGVAYNRSGSPVISIELTERELPVIQYRSGNDENSGTTLSLKWEILNPDENSEYSYKTYGTPTWLDDKKMSKLGFDMKRFKNDIDKYKHRTSNLSRDVILVLEYDGESYRTALAVVEKRTKQLRLQVEEWWDDDDLVKKLERAEKLLSRFKTSQTRLYVIDAGMDEQELMQKYSGKENILLARGEVGLRWDDDVVSGRIKRLFVTQVHVPLPLSEQFASLTKGVRFPTYKNFIEPRYKAQLNVGQRLEPWVEAVAGM